MTSDKLTDMLGRCWAFPPQFSPSTGVKKVEGIDAVLQSLHVLFITEAGERIMREDWGGGLNDFIFKNISDDLLAKIHSHIEENILRSETRVILKDVAIKPDENEASRLRVRATVYLAGSEITETLEGTLNLNEGQSLRLL